MRDREGPSTLVRLLPFLIPALLVHLLIGATAERLLPWNDDVASPTPTSLVILQPTEPEPDEPPEPEREDPTGQIVELPEPKEEVEPEEADYLAEHDVTVVEETRTDEVDINPEVLAPTFSEEQKMQQAEEAVDVQVDKPSTGAVVGAERFDPARDGTLRNLPSPWRFTNKEGLADPVPASHATTDVRGAPQNDLLHEERGDRVALNAKEYLYAGYLNRIRRLVNFYWEQNLDNIPRGTPLAKSSYRTAVGVVLTRTGAVERIEITDESGSDLMDHAVVSAFELAGPFPNPPEGLIEKDGRVYLPDMSFTVRLGTARLRYDGVDPRAGVQFPGLMKSPR